MVNNKSMGFEKEWLDLVLVPSGVGLMFVYHLLFLYKYLNFPQFTVMGFENHSKRAWVERVMELEIKYVDTALSVISNNTSASTYLASISLTMSSLIGAWMANNNNIFESKLIYGDTSSTTMTMKYISLLICFLVAFACFIQATRCFIHANYLISMPNTNTPISYVENSVIRGGEFWQLGLRALYFALNMLFWFFGPIPLFISSSILVFLLHHFDSNSIPLHRYQPLVKKQGVISTATTTMDVVALAVHA